MRKIEITNGNGISGFIYPEYGGMLGRLISDGKEIFALDEERLSLSPLLAGGNPVLFPFPSRTMHDSYKLDGKVYHMPFHGLVTNSAFLVEEVQDDSVSLSICNSPSWKESCYPYDFKLTLSYKITENGVRMTAAVSNLSENTMPHCFGWHCYFTASDKAAFDLHVPMQYYIDYTDGGTKRNDHPDLCVATDYVFYDRDNTRIIIKNHTDGYRADITADDVFNVVTVCTRFDERICVEPWIGLPDSANTGRYMQYITANSTCAYRTEIELSELDR